jgi:hypothetical protein
LAPGTRLLGLLPTNALRLAAARARAL